MIILRRYKTERLRIIFCKIKSKVAPHWFGKPKINGESEKIFTLDALRLSREWNAILMTLASAVCGTQNALANRYRGMVLRATHLTGLFTDFGIYLGMKLKGHQIESWKLLIPAWITLAFLLGAIVSSFLFLHGRTDWLRLSGYGYIGGGVVLSLCKRKTDMNEA